MTSEQYRPTQGRSLGLGSATTLSKAEAGAIARDFAKYKHKDGLPSQFNRRNRSKKTR